MLAERTGSAVRQERAGKPTLAAILTPLGQGGIAVLKVLGPRAIELVREVFRARSARNLVPDPSRLYYGHILEGDQALDEVLVRFVPAANGREAAEVNCHGGVVAVQEVMRLLVSRGVEAVGAEALIEAEASLLEAEARKALLKAPTRLGAEVLLWQLGGALADALRSLPWGEAELVADELAALLATARFGRALWQPPTVALVGPTNAGKSTLFNALAREERMIVSPEPGTTRDAVRAEVALEGIPVWLTDTAGEREPTSPVEDEAIERSARAAADADLAVVVLDGSAPEPVGLKRLGEALADRRSLVAANKADLGVSDWAKALDGAVVISAATGQGLEELQEKMVSALVGDYRWQPGQPVVFTERQARLLGRAVEALGAGDPRRARAIVQSLLDKGE